MTNELEIELLKNKVLELTQKNKLLSEIAIRYADPLKKGDKGKFARMMLEKIGRGYKPVINELCYMYKKKGDILPFIEFDHVKEGYPDE
jgi:hypothetical protein